jgi:hypothetical protein
VQLWEQVQGETDKVAALSERKEPQAWFLGALLSGWSPPHRFNLMKKARLVNSFVRYYFALTLTFSDAGYTWAQVELAWYYLGSTKWAVADLEKCFLLRKSAADAGNCYASFKLAESLHLQDKDVAYMLEAATGGWQEAMVQLSYHYYRTEKFTQSMFWAGQAGTKYFWSSFTDVERELQMARRENIFQDMDVLIFETGKHLYWKFYDLSFEYPLDDPQTRGLATQCLNFYCYHVESWQRSIWLFIWFFKKKHLKDVAVMIGKRVWKERHFIKNFCQWEGPDSDGLFSPTILF